MGDFLTMQNRIAREIQREGMTADIRDAILDAIGFYRNQRLRFNTQTASAQLTASVRFVTVPNLIQADFVELSGSASGVTSFILRKDSFENVRQSQNSLEPTSTVTPARWSRFGTDIHFDGRADDNYHVRVFGLYELPEVSASGSSTASNAWVTEGERLIRYQALSYLYDTRMKNHDRAMKMESRAKNELKTLKAELATADKVEPYE